MNYKNYNDYELIYMVRENDDESHGILYEKYLPIIKRMASDYYSRYQGYGYEYDDFFQEAMIAFQKAIMAYNEERGSVFYSFVTLCIKRKLLSFCRNISSDKRGFFLQNSIDIQEVSISDEKSDIASIFHEYELQNICQEVIYDLPFEAGIILELRLNGFSYREIGVLLDIPRSSVEFKSREARKKMRIALQSYNCK